MSGRSNGSDHGNSAVRSTRYAAGLRFSGAARRLVRARRSWYASAAMVRRSGAEVAVDSCSAASIVQRSPTVFGVTRKCAPT